MPHPLPTPSSSTIDAKLWDAGYNNACTPGAPHELDFLRGFHDLPSLTQLRDWLQSNCNSKIRLTSVWQDKYGNVVPKPVAPGQHYNYQEIADLAVFVRDARNNLSIDWMWLLQAKVVTNSSDPLPTGKSTDREIYLYESMPDFTWYGKQSLGYKFRLKKDFPGPTADYKHWSFLCFRCNEQQTPSNKFIDVRWPGSSSRGLAVASFCGELLELVTHFSVRPVPANVYGAPITPHSEWEKLAQQILHKPKLVPQYGHASRVRGKKADVLICAMLAESNAGVPIWIDAKGHYCWAGCEICFADSLSQAVRYSSISTGFDNYRSNFELSQPMQAKWEAAERELGGGYGDSERDNGGRLPPMGDDQSNDEDGGGGAKLTLFVDVAFEDARKPIA